MPTVSIFYGIRISFNFNDHYPPHFHAEYAGSEAMIDILHCAAIKSALPKRQLKLVLAWAELHKDELMQNWELARTNDVLMNIEPLK